MQLKSVTESASLAFKLAKLVYRSYYGLNLSSESLKLTTACDCEFITMFNSSLSDEAIRGRSVLMVSAVYGVRIQNSVSGSSGLSKSFLSTLPCSWSNSGRSSLPSRTSCDASSIDVLSSSKYYRELLLLLLIFSSPILSSSFGVVCWTSSCCC